MFKIISFTAALLLGTVTPSFATPVATFANGSASQAEAAFAQWQSGVSSFSVDQLNGATGSAFAVTTQAGSKFVTSDDRIDVVTSNLGVLQGTALQLNRSGKSIDVVWTLAAASNAFGFFGYDFDDGALTVTFSDGSVSVYSNPTVGNELYAFWGISGLGKDITSVAITTTDPGGVSLFDRFVIGTSVTRNTVPEPSSIALFGVALAGLIAVRKRKEA